MTIRTTQNFAFGSVTAKKVEQGPRKIKRNKAFGIDNFPPNLLKDVADVVSKSIVYIINRSLVTSEIPNLWKTSKVTPIYKLSVSTSDFNNYRPISVLPCLSKFFEKSVNRQLVEYLENNHLIKEEVWF